MVRNTKQSEHVDKARARAEKRFKRARDKSNKQVKALKEQIDESFSLLLALGQESSVPTGNLRKLITSFGVNCMALGRILQRKSDFKRSRIWMKEGIISKQSLIEYLSKKSGSTGNLVENVELFDLSFGSSYGARLKWNTILSASAKRQIRNTLWKRVKNRKKTLEIKR